MILVLEQTPSYQNPQLDLKLGMIVSQSGGCSSSHQDHLYLDGFLMKWDFCFPIPHYGAMWLKPCSSWVIAIQCIISLYLWPCLVPWPILWVSKALLQFLLWNSLFSFTNSSPSQPGCKPKSSGLWLKCD